jgi:hypothetical protein
MDRQPVHSTSGMNRRTVLGRSAALATVLGVGAARPSFAADEATPVPMTGHPLIGIWIIDRDITSTAEVPVVVVFTADGSFIDPGGLGAAGVWEPTGPRSAAMTLIPFDEEATGGYIVVRSTMEIDGEGDTWSGPASATVVGPDGTVVVTEEYSTRASRMRVDPMANAGQPLAGFPTWMPEPPATATPIGS